MRWATFCASMGLMVGCSAVPLVHAPRVVREHVISVDGNGQPRDPSTGCVYNMQDYRDQISCIFKAMHAFHKDHPDRKILVFVHGGLNAPDDALRCADQEMDAVMKAGYYPIYLNWNSDLLNTYGEHISSIRQGQTDAGWGRWVMTPFYLVSDIGRAAVRIPIVWVNQAAGDLAGATSDVAAIPRQSAIATATQPAPPVGAERWASGTRGQALLKKYLELKSKQTESPLRAVEQPRDQLRIYIGPDMDVRPGHMASLAATYILTSPLKYALQPLIDWIGTPSWQVMSRRTLMAFDGELGGNPSNPDLSPDEVGQREMRGRRAVDFSTTGAMEVFREELQNVIETHHDPATTRPSDYHVTLIGHSMGTMVLNEWLRRDLLESKGRFYSNIVYMAAACSVRDFGRAVVPYLLQNKGTQFYNLMLHPLADYRERRRFYDIPPRGSLLVWLDNFLTDPQAPLDRTMGRWDNIIPATEVIPQKIRGQITLKAFALAPYNTPDPPANEPDYGPQEHGQFRGRPYWREDFWSDQKPVISKSDDAGR